MATCCAGQALVRAYVRGGEAAGSGQESLAEEELQEGLMAGFGARARRKHMQRHAAMPSACVRTGTAADGATGADGVNARSEAAPLAAEILHLGDIDQPPANGCADGSQSGVPGGKSARVSGADSLSSSSLPAINRLMELEQGPDSSQESENVEDRAVERLGLGSKQSLAAVGARDLNKGGHQWHGRKVVEAALERGGEEELCQLTARFRQCFVDALQPKHLSPSWQIDHRRALTSSLPEYDTVEGSGCQSPLHFSKIVAHPIACFGCAFRSDSLEGR